MRRILLWIFLCSASVWTIKAQSLALKTDALWDLAMTPNLGLELVMGNRTSINLSVFGNHKPWGQNIQMYGLQPEFRYWFSGHPMFREFIGVAFYLSPHWNLECYGSFGAVWYDQKHYYETDNYKENYRNSHGYALIPFKIGVSFVYIFK